MSVTRNIVVAGGCFWCVEAAFLSFPGVISANPGYANGTTENPTYQQVCKGDTNHAEVCKVVYDVEKTGLEQLLQLFFKIHDPTQLNRQGNDIGTQYRSGIYYVNEEEREIAERAKANAQKGLRDPIVTEITPLKSFWEAEEYHHNYWARNPGNGYCQAVIPAKLKKVKDFVEQH
eukprot:comp15046_c0_seq1/m.22391 comp15046_c0_seq1/g.22391  ORF comp15046_c0_seq1/g.22391 comp15046_c0_seq1/m.22391 type:complete len:175 (-) comp15046_c0_seq1:28-552(-)